MNRINAALPVAAPLAIETAGDPRQQDLERALAGQLGKTLRGDVLAKLNDGSYLVKVAGAAARMMLPSSTQVGGPVTLHLVALQPRPTFQVQDASGAPGSAMTTQAGPALLPGPDGSPARAAALAHTPAATVTVGSAAQGLASAADDGAPAGTAAPPGQAPAARLPGSALSPGAVLLSKAPLLPASTLPPIDPASTPDHLSAGARTIASVLAAAAQAPRLGAVTSSTPLLPGGPVQAQFVAQALREALGRSGLFYESHVREWSEGTRPLAELAHEPQMRAAQEPGASARGSPADPATAAFINLQLETQEQGKIVWHGQLLPGQPLEWHIERDPPQGRGEAGDEAEAPWRSGLRLRFEALGEIQASIVLTGSQVHLLLDAAAPDVAHRLRAQSAELGNALEAAGALLGSFTVRQSDVTEAPRPGKPLAAVALAYQAGDGAPRVVAKGKGLIAEQIIEKAGEAGVFVHESKDLVALLMTVELDKQIPPLLYRVVAELLAWLYHVEAAQQAGTPLPEPPEVDFPIE